MPRLVIRSKGNADTRFELEKGSVVIGRGESADVLLPNVSVSREHARLVRSAEGWFVMDLKSKSGTLVNGEAITKTSLKVHDEIQIGRYTLFFLGEGERSRFLDGRFVEYLGPYTELLTVQGETIPLPRSAIDRMREAARRRDKARVVSVVGKKQVWTPGEAGLSFGGKGTIPVEGLFTGGVVASIRWEDASGGHLLAKRGMGVTVKINDHAVSEQTLLPGDWIKVGKSRFRYEVD